MLFSIVYCFAYVVLGIIYRFKFIGKENLPDGKCVICGNHTAIIDPVLCILAFGPKQRYRIIGKQEVFKYRFFGMLLRFVGVFPVDRDGADITAIKTALRTLKEDKYLFVFPEGARVKNGISLKTGEPPEYKNGAAMFAVRSNAPIVPVFIPEGRKAFKRNVIIFGEPIYPVVEGKGTQAELDAITKNVMAHVHALNPKREKAS